MSCDVCVIGAGITGLSVALNIQKLMRLVKVTIIADAIGIETNNPVTSNLFIPAPFNLKDVDLTTAREWYADGWEHHFALAKSDEGAKAGNTFKNGECLWWHDGEHVIPSMVADYRLLPREEMDEKEYNYAKGCEFTTVHVDSELYLRWLLKQIRMNGGHIIFDTTFSFHELYGKYDVVVNCVGRRHRELKADYNLQYLRGSMIQTTRLTTDRFFIAQDDIYICPHFRKSVCNIGFIWEPDNRTNYVDEDTQWLLQYNAGKFIPQVKRCKILKAWGEKRPERDPMLEVEFLNCGGPILPIIHNIGHGENTVSLAWGRGVNVARLVQEVWRSTRPFARPWMPFNRL